MAPSSGAEHLSHASLRSSIHNDLRTHGAKKGTLIISFHPQHNL